LTAAACAWPSDGFDRTSLTLPGRQDDLVAAVAATGTPTIAVINAGSPVLLPWRDETSALLVTYFGWATPSPTSLLGTVEPGGRLPTTWPKTEDDVPVLNVTPADGKVSYDEGIHIGYCAGCAPAPSRPTRSATASATPAGSWTT